MRSRSSSCRRVREPKPRNRERDGDTSGEEDRRELASDEETGVLASVGGEAHGQPAVMRVRMRRRMSASDAAGCMRPSHG